MGTWEWTVNGKKVRGEGSTEEEAWENYNFVNPGKEAGGEGRGYPMPPSLKESAKETFKSAAKGYAQGVLDPFEGGAQFIEHMTGHKIAPEWLRNWARGFRKNVESSGAGEAGRLLGNIFNPVFLAAGPVGGVAAGFGTRALLGAAGGAAQPVEGAQGEADYLRAKGWQALAGGTAGALAPSLGNLAARWAGNLPTHFGWHRPLRAAIGATAGPTIQAAGQGLSRAPAGGLGRAAGQLMDDASEEEQSR